MNWLSQLARSILHSRPLRAVFATLMEDYREANLLCVAVAVNASVVNQTPGDYLEFGVHTGRSFIRAYQCYERTRRAVLGWRDYQNIDPSRLMPTMRFFAFDAFDRGFPEPTGPDASDLKPLHWTAGGMLTAERDFRAACDRAGLDRSRIYVLAG